MTKWTVEMTNEAETELRMLLACKLISKDDINVILKWIKEMEEYGPKFIKSSPEWHDHPLEREWFGYRSSAFSSSGRIIYRIIENKILVEVHRVTPKHNYKK